MLLTNSLMGVWNLDEASGNALDSFGSNTLTQNGTIGTLTGLSYPTARNLVRANSDNFSAADSAAFSVGTGVDMTFCGWMRPTSTSGFRTGGGKDDYGTGNREYNLGTDGNKFQCQVNGAGQLFANTFGVFTINTWYFVLMKFKAATNNLQIGVNDVFDSSTSASGGINIVDGTAPFRLGSLSNNGSAAAELWDGGLAQFALWKRELSAAECTYLYNLGRGLKSTAFSVAGRRIGSRFGSRTAA